MRISDWSSDVCSSDRADHHGDDRQGQVPEVIPDLRIPRQLAGMGRGQPAQWKPVEILAAGENDDQQYGEEEGGDGVADDDDRAGGDIEARAVARRLGDAEGRAEEGRGGKEGGGRVKS